MRTPTIGFLLVFGLLLQQPVAAQQSDQQIADSLARLVPAAKEDTGKVNLYAQLMLAHLYYQPARGLTYAAPAWELAQQLNWKPGMARVKHSTARLHWRLGNFEQALTLHQEALALYKQTGNRSGAGKVLIEIGQDYLDQGKLEEAKKALLTALEFNRAANDLDNLASTYDILTYLYDVEGNSAAATQTAYDFLKLSEKMGDKNTIAHSAHMLASNYLALGNTAEALKYFKRGLEVSKQSGDQIEQLHFYISIADIYLSGNQFSEAFRNYTVALDLVQALKDQQMMGYLYRRMGHYYRALNQLDRALTYFHASDSAYTSISNKQDLAALYADMATVYTVLKQYKTAERYFAASKQLYDGLNRKMSMTEYYAGKQQFDSATGNWQSAYLHFREYVAIKDSNYSKESLQKLIGSQLQFDNEKKEAVKRAAQEQKDLLAREEIKRQRNIRNASFAVLAAMLVFSLIALYQRNKLAKEKKRSDQLLQDKELLLREIHHRVKNNLEVVSSLLALQSAQIDDAPTKDAMQESQNRVQSIGIVHQKLYQGTNLGSIEMKDYFLNLSESILDSFGAEQRVTIECAMDQLDVDIDTAVPLGLIVNELLTNTLKYAFPEGQPGKVRIKLLRPKEGVLHLEVSDNGVGKSGITKGTGFGGQLISLLTRQLNGTMKEEVHAGTRIYFEFKTGKAA